MGRTYDKLDKRLHGWIAARHIFFVATAPRRRGGHVNLSPEGHADTFAVLDERTVAYLGLTGSGAETAARDDGRITLMFCAFSGPPRILRLYGQDGSSSLGEQRWGELAAWFPARRRARAVVVVEVERIADSCGYAVPLYDYAGSATYSTSGQGARTRLPWPPTVPSATAGASTASPLCPLPPVTGRRARAEGRVELMSEAAGMLPGDHPEDLTVRHVDA